MPYKEREIKKKYFTIGEVANSLELSTSQIRFWESEFDQLNPKKNSKGSRKFMRQPLDPHQFDKVYSVNFKNFSN